jgi:hypothetical protein
MAPYEFNQTQRDKSAQLTLLPEFKPENWNLLTALY